MNLLIMLFLVLQISAQDIAFKHFNSRNGLPASEIYDIHQDKNGFLWFATDKGLCRYDGHDFRIYTTLDGLSENVVFSIHEDRNNVLWFCTFTKGICCWNGHSFYVPDFNVKLLQLISKNSWVKNIVFDSQNRAWLNVKYSSHNTVYVAHASYVDVIKNESLDSARGMVIDVDGNYLENTSMYNKEQKLDVRMKNGKFYVYSALSELLPVLKLRDGSIIAASNHDLFQFDKNGLLWTYNLKGVCNSIYSDDGKLVWVATTDGALAIRPGSVTPEKHYFRGNNISSILKDKEGSYWFATLNAGAFMVPSFDVNVISLPAAGPYQRINTLYAASGSVFFGSYDGKLFRMDQRLHAEQLAYSSQPTYLHALFADDQYLFMANGYRINLRKKKPETWMSNSVKCILKLDDKRMFVGYTSGFGIFENGNRIFSSPDSGFRLRVLSACKDEEGNIWIGTLYGIYRFQYGTKNYPEKMLLNKRVNHLVFSKGILFAGTSEEGIYCFKNGKTSLHLNETDGLAGNYVSQIYIPNMDTLWVATHKGISRLLRRKGGYKIDNISREDGLPANEVNAVCYLGKYLCVATDMGLATFFPEKLIRRNKPYYVYLDRIRVNEKDTIISKEYVLEYDQRNISISFGGLTLKYPERLQYYYKLEGTNEAWIPTRERNLQFANLPPGKYKLHLATASLDNPLLRGPETIVDFFIKRHFTQTSWFIGLITFTALGLILFMIYQYIRGQQQKVKNREELILAEQKALRAQMNPHFIFNAMNSIQHYVYENNRDSAGMFLSKFASLIRVILENSGNSMITLEEEISCVRQYLELERLRFANRFRFDIEIDENISLSDTKIPSMMIQPFLENAIWHGIMPRQSEGDVRVCISRMDDYIYCCIDDNGIGRKMAESLKNGRSLHKSAALKNIRERINLINMVYKMDMKLEIDDKEDEQMKSSGTKVTLSYKIPGYEYN